MIFNFNFYFCTECEVAWSIIGLDKCWICKSNENVVETFYNGEGNKFVCPAMRQVIGG